MFDQTATQEQVFDLVAKGVVDKYAARCWLVKTCNIRCCVAAV